MTTLERRRVSTHKVLPLLFLYLVLYVSSETDKGPRLGSASDLLSWCLRTDQ